MGVALLPQHKVAALLGARRPAGAAPVQGCASRLPRLSSPHLPHILAGPQGLHQYKLRLPFAETAQLPSHAVRELVMRATVVDKDVVVIPAGGQPSLPR